MSYELINNSSILLIKVSGGISEQNWSRCSAGFVRYLDTNIDIRIYRFSCYLYTLHLFGIFYLKFSFTVSPKS